MVRCRKSRDTCQAFMASMISKCGVETDLEYRGKAKSGCLWREVVIASSLDMSCNDFKRSCTDVKAAMHSRKGAI